MDVPSKLHRDSHHHRIVFLQGATASGKSQLALRWAQQFSAEIINCDSIQCYERLRIGAAMPSLEDFRACPHHLYGYVPLSGRQTAGDYRRFFYEQLEALAEAGPRNLFVVGGTGFYYQAIEKGMYPTLPEFGEIRAEIEEQLRQGQAPQLYEELKVSDPEAAQKISLNDHYRLGRALEIIRGEGRSLSDLKREFEARRKPFPFPLLKLAIGIEREELRRRVKLRTENMVKEGLIEEVSGLVAEGFADSFALQSVGYREVLSYLQQNSKSQGHLLESIEKSTMALAKKQMTWFRRDCELFWLRPDDSSTRLQAEESLKRFFQA